MKKELFTMVCLLISLFTSAQERIQMRLENGVYTIPCSINGLRLRFIFDTGASRVLISATEAAFMLKNEYLSSDDFQNIEEVLLADGSVVENAVIVLKEVKIGSKILNNVTAYVSNNLDTPLLLGQSAISLLGTWQMSDGVLILGDSTPSAPEDVDAMVKQYETRGDLASAYTLLKNSIVQDDYKSYERWIFFIRNNIGLLETANVDIDVDLYAQLLFEAVMADYDPLVTVFKENTYYPFSFVKDKTKMLYYYEALFNKGYHIVGRYIAETRYFDNNISFENYIYYLEQSAIEGDIDSYRRLGSAYSNEFKLIKLIGTEVNISKSLYWYKKAADKNDPDSQYSYAMTLLGMDNPSSEQKLTAVNYLKKAANNNHKSAISELVTEYYYGQHVNKNLDNALLWAKKLENDEEWKWWANAYIGFIYNDKDDNQTAAAYLKKATNVENEAQSMWVGVPSHTYGLLGEMYYLGDGVDQNDEIALKLLLKEIEVSNSEDVIYCYMYVGDIYDQKGNYAKSFPYVKYAAEHNYAYSQAQMAKYYMLGETTDGVDHIKAEQWAQKAINNKDASDYILGYSYRTLGNIYNSTNGLLYDTQKAIVNYEKASLYNDSLASFLLGEIYENGEGEVGKNFKLAEKYYRLAVEQGHEDAKEKLELFQ